MASGIAIKLTFDTMRGSKTWTYNHAKPSATAEQVRTAAQAMIDNGSVYEYVPVRLTKALKVVTEESAYEI